MLGTALVLAGGIWVGTPGAWAEEGPLFDGQGYRLKDYRAPVPAEAPGARTITLSELQALQSEGAVLLDVMGLRQFEIGQDGVWITPEDHLTIPGAIWLPVVGWGKLEEWQQAYLEQGLARLTEGDLATKIVVFCKLDCWLSWNAAQRISALGYRQLYWFPPGVDGWSDAGLKLVLTTPLPRPPMRE